MNVFSARSVGWGLAGLIVAAGLVWSFWPQAVLVDFATVERGAMRVTVSDEGRTHVREVFAVSAPIGGRLLRVTQRAGDAVVAGETVVAQLQPTDPGFLDIRSRAQAEAAAKAAEAAITLARAEVERARAQLQYAENELKRIQTLVARGTASEAELDRAKLAARTARTTLGTADAAVAVKEFELETAKALLIDFSDASKEAVGARFFVEMKAPVTGRVLRVLQESEAVVPVGTPILEIGDPADLEIVVDLLSTDAVKVAEGAIATIDNWGGSEILVARVRRVEPFGFTKISALGVEEQRVNVVLDIDTPRERWEALGHGYKVDVEIVIWEGADLLIAPVSALFRHADGWAAFVLRDGDAVLTPVGVGRLNDVSAEVLSGLAPGDRVVVHPSDKVSDGVALEERPR